MDEGVGSQSQEIDRLIETQDHVDELREEVDVSESGNRQTN